MTVGIAPSLRHGFSRNPERFCLLLRHIFYSLFAIQSITACIMAGVCFIAEYVICTGQYDQFFLARWRAQILPENLRWVPRRSSVPCTSNHGTEIWDARSTTVSIAVKSSIYALDSGQSGSSHMLPTSGVTSPNSRCANPFVSTMPRQRDEMLNARICARPQYAYGTSHAVSGITDCVSVQSVQD